MQNKFSYPIIFFVSLTVLLLEIILTRIFSLIFFYHLSFMAVSLALLGLGVGGLVIFLVNSKDNNKDKFFFLSVVVMPWSIVLLLVIFASESFINLAPHVLLVFSFFACLLPFFLAGYVISYLIKNFKHQVSQLYFFDMLGSALGAFLVILILKYFGGDNGLIVVAFMASLPSIFLSGSFLKRFLTPVILILFFVGNYAFSIFVITPQKISESNPPIFSQWNSFSTVGVYRSENPNLLAIKIDAAAETDLLSGDYVEKKGQELTDQIQTLVYYLKNKAEVLIIGPGGGRDIATALLFNQLHITGVEINPIIVNNIMKDQFKEYSGKLYFDPRVTIEVDEGRSFIRRSSKKYDIIQATLVDTWAATSAGAFTLTENNLYTVEAFREYLDHLNDNGILSFTRWYVAEEPAETLRLISLGLSAAVSGSNNLNKQIAILSDNLLRANFLLKKTPFTVNELESIKKIAQEKDYSILYLPGEQKDNIFYRYLNSEDFNKFCSNYTYNIDPPKDDKPFFFYTLKLKNFFKSSIFLLSEQNNLALSVLIILFFIIMLAVLVFFAVPLFFHRKKIKFDKLIFLFVFLGIGYIFAEIVFMQKFILFLGHPIYSLTVILAGLLVATGIGSLSTKNWLENLEKKIIYNVLIIAGIFITYSVVLPVLFHGLLWVDIFYRVFISLILIFFPGFFMGRCFPTCIKLISSHGEDYIAWSWAINSACSVFGSVLAVIIAINFGYNLTLLCATLFYLMIVPVILLRR